MMFKKFIRFVGSKLIELSDMLVGVPVYRTDSEIGYASGATLFPGIIDGAGALICLLNSGSGMIICSCGARFGVRMEVFSCIEEYRSRFQKNQIYAFVLDEGASRLEEARIIQPYTPEAL